MEKDGSTGDLGLMKAEFSHLKKTYKSTFVIYKSTFPLQFSFVFAPSEPLPFDGVEGVRLYIQIRKTYPHDPPQIQLKEKNFPDDLNKKIANAIKAQAKIIHAEIGDQPIIQDLIVWLDSALAKLMTDPKFIESSYLFKAKDGSSCTRYKLLSPKNYAKGQATAEATKNFLERCKRQEEEAAALRAAEAEAAEQAKEEWVCEACTYLNPSGLKCEICEAVRPIVEAEEEEEEGKGKDKEEREEKEKREEKNEKENEKEKEKEENEKEKGAEPIEEEREVVQRPQVERYYTCRMCGYRLCDDKDIEPHEPVSSGRSFSKRKGQGHLTGEPAPCTSLFLKDSLSFNWMGDMEEAEGKFCCPKCKGKIGSYHWSGAPCSCGYWTVPAIQIHKCRVDDKIKS